MVLMSSHQNDGIFGSLLFGFFFLKICTVSSYRLFLVKRSEILLRNGILHYFEESHGVLQTMNNASRILMTENSKDLSTD